MATCPSCHANSRTDPTFTVAEVLVAKPYGSYSLAGFMTKITATATLRLSHSCGWSVTGHVDGSDFVADEPAPVADHG